MARCLDVTVLMVVIAVWCFASQSSDASLLFSTTKLESFLSLDPAVGLDKYIKHEGKRLEVIKSAKGYEEEVPLVIQRLEILKNLSQELAAKAAERDNLKQSMKDFHPTTILRLIQDFRDTWSEKLSNSTLYGFRLKDFLTEEKSQLPSDIDLEAIAQAIAEVQYIYNLSTFDLYAGKVMTYQGAALKPVDAFVLGNVSMRLGHLEQAVTWFELLLTEIQKDEKFAKNMSHLVAETKAKLGVIKYSMDKKTDALRLLEEAADLDPDNEEIVKQFLSHRFGRDVRPLVELVPDEGSKHWFQLCTNASTFVLAPSKWYHVCRYRNSLQVPYRVYKEEILNRSPFLSLVYDFVKDSDIKDFLNITMNKLRTDAVHGAEPHLHFVEGTSLIDSVPVAGKISKRITDFTGLDTTQRHPYQSSGEPIHVLNYGVSGAFKPHVDTGRQYRSTYIMRQSGKRMATVLIYLSDVKLGGATAFPALNITVIPKKGSALLWFNTSPSGEPEADVKHAGCPVAVGAKWVASKGVWDWGNEFRRPCGRKSRSSQMEIDKLLRRKTLA